MSEAPLWRLVLGCFGGIDIRLQQVAGFRRVGVVRISSAVLRPDADFDVVYRTNYVSLKRLAFLLTRSDADAEDVVQDVFVRCRSRLGSLDDPPMYLRRAVINGCHSLHRRRRRTPVEVADVAAVALPAELVELRDALGRLRPKLRSAVVLRYYLDLSFDEIAAMLGCRPATVRSLIHRAVNELRGVLR